MYNIILTNGKIININATKAEWYNHGTLSTIRLIKDNTVIAEFNMNNVAGLVTNGNICNIESEDKLW